MEEITKENEDKVMNNHTTPPSTDNNNNNATNTKEEKKEEDKEHGIEDDDVYVEDGNDEDYYEDDEEEDLNTSGVLYNYWLEDEALAEEPPQPPQHKSILELHRELSRDRILASDDDLVMLEHNAKEQDKLSTSADTPSKVKFHNIKKVLYFEKHPEEDSIDLNSYNYNHNGDDDDEDDYDPYAQYYQQQQQQQYYQQNSYDYDDDEEEDEDEEEEEDSWSDDEEEEDDDDQDDSMMRNRFRSYNGILQKQYQQQLGHGDTDDGYNNYGEDDENDDDDDNNSVNSVEEHSDNENNKQSSSPFFDISSYNPYASSTPSTSSSTATVSASASPSILNTTPINGSTDNNLLRKRPQIIRYTPRFTNQQHHQQQQQQQDDDEESEEEEDEDEDEDDQYDSDDEILVHPNNSQNGEELDEMIEKRSEIERTLRDYREKSEHERRRLRECFNLAKQNLKQKIDLVSKQFNSNVGAGGSQVDHSDSIKDELEEVLDSLSVLQKKIDDMEHSLDDDHNNSSSTSSPSSTSPFSHQSSTTTRKQKLASKSLVTEFMHLKEQIEKERKEKIARDKELEDITKHLLEMALQVSNTLFTKNNQLQQQPPQPQPTQTTEQITNDTNNNNNNNNGQQQDKKDGSIEEIEFYRNQIKLLEERLMVWKHHNDMLHEQLLMDKQTNSQEFLNLTSKIQKVEEERDKLCVHIDNLVQELGMMEGRESVLSNMIEDLMNDKESLSETLIKMNKERDMIATRFSQLLMDLQVMGENQVNKLQVIVDELTREREALENDIHEIKTDRNNLIANLNTLHLQISTLENDKNIVSDQYRSSEESNNRLLLQTQETIKRLETSEIKCTHLQNQLHIVNRRLSWAESEVERLTKEMNRILLVDGQQQDQEQQEDVEDEGEVVDNENNSNNNNEKIKNALENIRENVLKMKNTLLKEKNDILQLNQDLAMVVERGKSNSTKTISALKDYILREVEITKSEISTKLKSIHNDQISTPTTETPNPSIGTTKEILQEMEYQKTKLNEMQTKITKLETQIQEMANDNNSYLGDQVGQLMRMECKIRKMEAGISELIDYKSPPMPIPPSSTTSTTTTTTITHHYLSPVLSSSTNNENEQQQPPLLHSQEDTATDTPTPRPNNNDNETLTTNNSIENDKDNDNNNITTGIGIGNILKDSMVIGGSAFFTSLLFAFFNNDKGVKISRDTVLSLCRKSGVYGIGVVALTSSLLLVHPLFNNNNNNNKVTSTSQQQQQSSKSSKSKNNNNNGKEILVSLSTGAIICASVLYGKHRNIDYLLTGSTIGLALGSLSSLLSRNKQ